MALPMMAQLAGAAVNIIIDPILIFGLFGAPELGIYYKIQSFFSFRCWDFSRCCFRLSALILSGGLMLAATMIFMIFPQTLLSVFSSKKDFQGITKMKLSVFIIVLRQIILLVPLAWILHFAGLRAVWWTFPLTEFIVATTCIIMLSKYEKIYGMSI